MFRIFDCRMEREVHPRQGKGSLRRPARLLGTPGILAGLLLFALLALPRPAFAWDVCVSGGTPSPNVYGNGTEANPYVVCMNDSFQIMFTATVCNSTNQNGECLPTGVTFTWPAPYPATGPTNTVKFGPFSSTGLKTYTIVADGTATGFQTPTGGPCPNPPPTTQSGQDTVYVVVNSNTAWTPVSAPAPDFPAPPAISAVTVSGTNFTSCPAPGSYDYQNKYVSTAQPDIQSGNWHYSACGGSVTASHTVTTTTPIQVDVSAFGVTIPVNLGGATQNYTSNFTAGPQAGLEFRVMRRTPAWYLNVVEYTRSTACYIISPGPYGAWSFAQGTDTSDFDELPGTVYQVWSECCQ